METVDQQLDNFEVYMHNELEFQLNVHTDFRFWEETDHLDNETLLNIHVTVRDIFARISNQYTYCPEVVRIADEAATILEYIVRAAMNVPYPRNPQLHIESVLDNVYDVYNRLFYARLRTEMIMATHNVHMIQRNWKKCVADPSYTVCQRRLNREFNELKKSCYIQNM